MSAIWFLFSHKLNRLMRRGYAIVGYEADSRDISERLYGIYLILFFAVWTILMLGWAEVTISTGLNLLSRVPALLNTGVFIILGVWLAVMPWLGQRSYDLYRFDLADIDFLVNSPLKANLVALAWFFKSWFGWVSAVLILVCGIIASAVSYQQHGNDYLALVIGLSAGLSFSLILVALRWLIAISHYRPIGSKFSRPLFITLLGYGLSGLLLVSMLLSQWIVWPAGLVSWLLAGRLTAGHSGALVIAALVGLMLTTVVSIAAIWQIAKNTGLTPAFERGKLGAEYRLVVSNRSQSADARLQLYLSRRLAKQSIANKPLDLGKARLKGSFGALVHKLSVRYNRVPAWQIAISTLVAIFSGCGTALALAEFKQSSSALPFLIQTTFVANFILLRRGAKILQRELAHYEFLTGWPLTRNQLMTYSLVLGFALPLISGEIALLAVGSAILSADGLILWLMLWPLLLGFSGVATLFDFRFALRNWAGTPETVPNVGIRLVIVAGIVWLATLIWGPTAGMIIGGLILFAYTLFSG